MPTTLSHPSVAPLVDGGYATSYSGWDGEKYNIYWQRFSADGTTLVEETQISSDASYGSTKSRTIANDDGGWAIF